MTFSRRLAEALRDVAAPQRRRFPRTPAFITPDNSTSSEINSNTGPAADNDCCQTAQTRQPSIQLINATGFVRWVFFQHFFQKAHSDWLLLPLSQSATRLSRSKDTKQLSVETDRGGGKTQFENTPGQCGDVIRRVTPAVKTVDASRRRSPQESRHSSERSLERAVITCKRHVRHRKPPNRDFKELRGRQLS